MPLFAPPAQATVPKYINFQGKLTKVSDGTNVTNGSYAFEFKLYDASTSGTLLWTETYDQPSGACTKLAVTSGVFNAKLGSCASLASIDFTGGSIYLSVNFAPTGVSYDGEMSPRKQLVASPFALVANSVSGDGPINTVNSSATALTVAKSGSNYGLQVDTSTASAATGLKITSAAAASGIALSAISSGTNESITLDAKGTGSVSLGATSTGDILLGGGSGSTGCTVTNSTGAFACTAGGSFTTLGLSGAITGATGITSSGTINFSTLSASSAVYTDGSKNLTSTAPTSGAIGYWSRSGTTLQPTTSNDAISITGNSGDIATLTSSATEASNKTLNISQTGATSGTDYGAYISNTGAATNNVGLYTTTSGATNNYAAIFDSGTVGFGTTAPTAGKLHILAANTTQPAIAVQQPSANNNYSILLASTNNFGSNNLDLNYQDGNGIRMISNLNMNISAGSALNLTSGTASTYALPSNTASALRFTDGTNSYHTIDTRTTNSTSSAHTFATTAPTIASSSTSAYLLTTFTPGTQTYTGTTNTTSTGATAPLSVLFNQPTIAGNGTRTITETSNTVINGPTIASSSSGTETITSAYGLNILSGSALNGTGGAVTNGVGLSVNAPTGATNNYAALFNGGNVGIGNTAPTETLDVTGNAKIRGTLKIRSASNTGNLSILDAGGGVATIDNTGNSILAINGGSISTNFVTGNVGIGISNVTTPNAALQIATNGAASTPGVRLDGTWYAAGTSTTNKPQLLVEPTGTTSTTWSGAGTGIGANAASGFTGNLLDLQTNNASKFSVASDGTVITASTIFGGNDIYAGSSSYLAFSSRSKISSPADSNLLLTNAAANAFNLLQFGGTSSSFPALKRSTTILQARLADDSGYTSFDAGNFLLSGTNINTAGTLTNVAYKNAANTFTANNIFQPTVTTGTGATAGVQIAANSLTTGNGLDVSSTSLTTGNLAALSSSSTAGGASGTSTLLNLSRTGVNSNTAHTAYGLYSTVTNTNVTSGTNIAAYLSASGATTANYGLIVAAGNVGIGTTTPKGLLEIDGYAGQTILRDLGAAADEGGWSFTTSATTLTLGSTNDANNAGASLLVAKRGTGTTITSLYSPSTSTNFGLGDSTPASLLTVGNGDLFQVNSSGAIAAATGITSSGTINFSTLSASSAVYTDGSKNLTSTAPTSGAIGYWSRSGTTLQPATSNDVVAISSNAVAAGGVLDITSSGTVTSGNNAIRITANSVTTGVGVSLSTTGVTTGTALNITGPSTTGVTTGLSSGFIKATSDVGSGGTGGVLAYLAPDYSSASAATSYGLEINGTDSTTVSNNNYNLYSNLAMSGDATSKLGVAIYGNVSSSSTLADTTYGGLFGTSVSGAISTGSRNNYGIYAQPNVSSANTGGITNVYGAFLAPASSNSTTGSTVNVYGSYTTNQALLTTGGTINSYGNYIANGSVSTTGTSTQYGLYVESQTGADNNYTAVFAGGNVGIGTTTPTAFLHVGSNGAASNPGLKLSGSWFTGGDSTTTKPQALIEASGATSSGWSTSGTGLGINAPSGFTGRMIDVKLNGTSSFALNEAGGISILGQGVTNIGAAQAYWYQPSGATVSIGNNGDTGASNLLLRAGASGSSGGNITFNINNSNTGIWNSAGFGIGTGTPIDPLSISTAINASATHALFNLSNTALSSGSANGTYIGANPAAFTGNFFDFQVASSSVAKLTSAGALTVSSCTGCGSGATTFDAIGDPAGNGAINMGTTVQTLDWGATTTTDNLSITSSGTGITSGSVLKVTSATTGAVSNGLIQFTASGAYTSTGGLLSVTGNSTATGTLAKFSATGLTTGTGLTIAGGTAMTTGTVLGVSSATYNHANGETGNMASLIFSDATTTAGAVTSTTNGLNIASTIAATTSTSGTKTVNAINIASPTLTSCTGGASCVWNGVQITAPATTASFTSTALKVVANSLTTDTVASISATGQTSGIGLSITGGGANLTASGKLIDLQMGAATVGAGLNILSSGVYTGAGLVQLTANSATSGVIDSISGTGLTSGSAVRVTGSGATMTTGGELIDLVLGANTVGAGMTITSTGAYTGTGAADGLINIVANSLSSGFGSQYSFTGMTSGTGIKITGGGANLTASGKLIDLQMGAATVGAGLNIASSGVYTGAGLVQLTANSATSGVIDRISGTGLTSGSAVRVTGSGATMTTGGELIDLVLGANTVGAGLTVTSTGTYTGSGAADGLINVVANSLTTGLGSQYSFTGMTTGTGIKMTGGTAMTTGGLIQIGNGTYNHVNGETGSIAKILVTDATTTAGAVTSTTNGLNIASTIAATTSTSGTKTINAINIASPTLTSCAGGASCVWNGMQITAPATTASFTSTALKVVADSLTTDTGVSISAAALTTGNALSITAGGATALTSGAGLKVTGPSGAAAIANGLVQITAAGAYTGTGGLLNVTSAASTAGTLVNFTNNTASFTGTAVNISTSGITSGSAMQITGGSSMAAGGQLLGLSIGTAGAGTALNIVANGGTYTGTGLLAFNSNSLTSGTMMSVAANGSGQTSAKYIDIAQTGVTTGFTGNLINLSSTSTTGAATFINLTANSSTVGVGQAISMTGLTTGSALTITGPSSTGVTGSGILKVTADVGSGGTQGQLVSFSPDYSAGTASTGYGQTILGTDSTSTANSDNNLYSSLALTGNAAKTGYAFYGTVTSNSTTADTTYGANFDTSITGAISTGTRNTIGVRSAPATSGANTGGTTQLFGGNFAPSSTGSTTGATVNVFGAYVSNTATLTTAGTINSYGLYVDSGTTSTTGTSTAYGAYILAPTGADTNTGLLINTANAASIGQVIKASTSQTADLLQFQNSSGTVLMSPDFANSSSLWNFYNTSGTKMAVMGYDNANNAAFFQSIGIDGVLRARDAINGRDYAKINLNYTSGYISLSTNTGADAVERMRIDATGAVGIGASMTAPKQPNGLQMAYSTTANQKWAFISGESGAYLNGNAYYDGTWRYLDGANGASMVNANSVLNAILFYTTATTGSTGGAISNWTEKMRIEGGGNVDIGTSTSKGLLTVAQTDAANDEGIYLDTEESTTTQTVFAIESDATSADTVKFKVTADGETSALLNGQGGNNLCQNGVFAGGVGKIGDCTSDRRLKTNIVDLDGGALEKIMQVKPRVFDWINGAGQHQSGFIAQEVQAVIPELYRGETADGYLRFSKDLLVPYLTKALQELNQVSIKTNADGTINRDSFVFEMPENQANTAQITGTGTQAVASTGFVINQKGSGNILQLQKDGMDNFLVANDGTVHIHTDLASGTVLEITNANTSLFTINTQGNAALAGTLVVKKDVAVLGRILGSTAIVAKNTSNETIHQGDLLMLTGATAEPMLGDQPTLTVAKAVAGTNTTIVGIADRNLSDFNINPDSPVADDPTTIKPGEYVSIVITGTYKKVFVNGSVSLGDKLTASIIPGKAEKLTANTPGQVFGISLDNTPDTTGSIRVMLLSTFQQVTQIVQQVPVSQAAPPAPNQNNNNTPPPDNGGTTSDPVTPPAETPSPTE